MPPRPPIKKKSSRLPPPWRRGARSLTLTLCTPRNSNKRLFSVHQRRQCTESNNTGTIQLGLYRNTIKIFQKFSYKFKFRERQNLLFRFFKILFSNFLKTLFVTSLKTGTIHIHYTMDCFAVSPGPGDTTSLLVDLEGGSILPYCCNFCKLTFLNVFHIEFGKFGSPKQSNS